MTIYKSAVVSEQALLVDSTRNNSATNVFVRLGVRTELNDCWGQVQLHFHSNNTHHIAANCWIMFIQL